MASQHSSCVLYKYRSVTLGLAVQSLGYVPGGELEHPLKSDVGYHGYVQEDDAAPPLDDDPEV